VTRVVGLQRIEQDSGRQSRATSMRQTVGSGQLHCDWCNFSATGHLEASGYTQSRPWLWTANVRLTNRRQLRRLRPNLINHDSEAIFEIPSDEGLCLTLGRLTWGMDLTAA
jgi:hypothetical protein